MSITILHTSDTHLDIPAVKFGTRRYERKNDFLKSFDRIIEYALEKKPDLFLHSGDLFDSLNPRNPVRAHVMAAFRKLSDKHIPIYIISGNHDVPRARRHGVAPLMEYARAEFVTFFDDWEEIHSKTINLQGIDIEISGISFNPTLLPSADPLSQLTIPGKGDVNILLTHYNVEGLRGTYPHEPDILLKSIPRKLTLLATGHNHEFQQQKVGNTTICTPGSTEHVTFSEENQKKGFVWLELDTDGVHQLKQIPVDTRPMQTINLTIPADANINTLLIKEIDRLRNPQLILRFRLKGVMTIKSAERYRRAEVVRHGFAKCFSTEIVDVLEYISPEPDLLLPETELKPPITEYRDFVNARIKQEKDDQKKKLLQLALERGVGLLEDSGGW
ncbi:MAG: exonuclease SbcCD subunit D [Candidatus Thorarchaeota archaeon]